MDIIDTITDFLEALVILQRYTSFFFFASKYNTSVEKCPTDL